MSFNGIAMNNFADKLSGMTRSELDDLFNNDSKIHEMVLQSPDVQRLAADKKRLLKSNQRRAKENLSLKPQMEQTKAELIAAHQEFNEALKEYSHFKSEIGGLVKSPYVFICIIFCFQISFVTTYFCIHY